MTKKVAALTGFYVLLVVTLAIAAFLVVRTSRSDIDRYNHITEKSIHISSVLLNISQEADEIQAAAVRMIFNPEETDVKRELENIAMLERRYAGVWHEFQKWMGEMNLKPVFDSLKANRIHYDKVRKELLETNAKGNMSNLNAVEFYYSHQMSAYNEYQEAIQHVSGEVSKNIGQQMYMTNVAVRSGSHNVNLWLLISFLVMVAGSILITTHNRKLFDIKQQLLQERQNKLMEITHQTLNAQETERNQLGKELHDNVNQLLTVARLNLSMVSDKPEKSNELVAKSINYLQDAIQEIRYLSKSLVNPITNNIPLQDSVRELVSCFQSVNEKSFFSFSYQNVDEDKMAPQLKLALYRIVQEQLNNIVKHADARQVSVEIGCQQNTLTLTVRDDGRGFDVTKSRHGIGINNIINRVEAFQGSVVIESAPAKGCTLFVKIPFLNKHNSKTSFLRRISRNQSQLR